MKRAILCVLIFAVLLAFSNALMAEAVDKTAINEAIEAFNSGQKLTVEQTNLLKSINFNFNPGINNELDDVGGPDGYGYMFKDSEEPDGPVYDWVDITGGPTLLLADDAYDGPFEIGFEFEFYGEIYTELWIHSNGILTFADEWVSLSNEMMPTTNYGAMIAWFWDDLDPDMGNYGTIYYDMVFHQDQDAFVITFENYYEYGWPPEDQGYLTAQVILLANGDILMQYADLGSPPELNEFITIDECTIGIQAVVDYGLTFLFDGDPTNNPYINQAIWYYQNQPDASVSGNVTDSVTGGGIGNAAVTVGNGAATTLQDGSYAINNVYSGWRNWSCTAAGYYGATGSVLLSTGGNTLNISMVPLPVYPWQGSFNTNFEVYPNHLLETETTVVWAWGEPTVEPAYSPVHCWATGIDENYINNAADPLVTATAYVPEAPDAYMSYWHTYQIESNFDGYNVRITTDQGANWDVIEPIAGYSDPDGVFGLPEPCFSSSTPIPWEQVMFDLSGYIGMEVEFMFFLGTDGSVTYPGVQIDDMEIYVGPEGPGLILMATPWEPLPEIPPFGGMFRWDAYVENVSDVDVVFDAWTDLILPNGMEYGPLDIFPGLMLMPGDVLAASPAQQVPGFAPPGEYLYLARVGDHGAGEIYAEAPFPFIKHPVAGATGNNTYVTDWLLTGWIDELDSVPETISVPANYIVEKAYPNPFNPVTHISVGLPENAGLNVAVYNVVGQQVATLAYGQYSQGYHTFTFDGKDLASGIYFVRTTVPGKMDNMQKIVLMK